MSFQKPVFVSLSPNTEKDDISLAFKVLFKFHKEENKKTEELERELKDYLNVKNLLSFNSGRSALMGILYSFNIQKDDEVLIQAFTCNAAINPIIERGARPIFVDIDNTLNIDPIDLERKITSNTKAVIIQHTFGWPAQIKKIVEICKRNQLVLIEDTAHSLGAEYEGKLCGTFGDASFFSFGRDKIISSVFGGAAMIKDESIFEKMKIFQKNISLPPKIWTLQQILHPILTNYIVLPSYKLNQYFGRIVIGFFHKISLLSKAVYKKEKMALIPSVFPKKMPSPLSLLALNQIKKIERFNEHRRKISEIYYKNIDKKLFIPVFPEKGLEKKPVFMRYPVLVSSGTDDILKKMRNHNIYLNDGWRKSPIVPLDTDLEKVHYVLGSCPRAEKIANRIINLPTHINVSENKAIKIVKLLNECIKN